MAEIVLQDKFEPYLLTRGFVRENRVFRRFSNRGLDMEVWLNPENRLKRVATVSVDVSLNHAGEEGPLYIFDQACFAQVFQRGSGVRDSSYSPDSPGWPHLIVEDFIRFTLPFIDSCRDPADLCDLLLGAQIPPRSGVPIRFDFSQTVWDIAQRSGLPEYAEAALKRLSLLRLSPLERESVQKWLDSNGIGGVVLAGPISGGSGWWRRLVARGSDTAVHLVPGFSKRWQNQDSDPYVRVIADFLVARTGADSFLGAYCRLWAVSPQRGSDDRADILTRLNSHLEEISSRGAIDEEGLREHVSALTWIIPEPRGELDE